MADSVALAGGLAARVDELVQAVLSGSGSPEDQIAEATTLLSMITTLVAALPDGEEKSQAQQVLTTLASELRSALSPAAQVAVDAARQRLEAATAAEVAARNALQAEVAKGYQPGVGGGIDAQTLNKPHEEAIAKLTGDLAAASAAREAAAAALAQAIAMQLALDLMGLTPAQDSAALQAKWLAADEQVLKWTQAMATPGAVTPENQVHLQVLITTAQILLTFAQPTDRQAINQRLDTIFDLLNGTYPSGTGRTPEPHLSNGTGETYVGADRSTNFRSGGLRQLLATLPADSPQAQAVQYAINFLEGERVQLLIATGNPAMLDQYLAIKNAEVAYFNSQAPWEELRWLFPGGTSDEQIASAVAQFRAAELPQVVNEMSAHFNDPQWLMRTIGSLSRQDVTRGIQALDKYFATPILQRGVVWYWRNVWTYSILQQVGSEQDLSEALNLAGNLPIDKLMLEAKTNQAAQQAVNILTQKGWIVDGHYAIPANVVYNPTTIGDQMGTPHWFDQIFNIQSAIEFIATVILPALAAGRIASLIAIAGKAPWWARASVAAVRVTSEAILFTFLHDLAKSGLNPFGFAKDLQRFGQDTAANLTVIVLLQGMGASVKAVEDALAEEVGGESARALLSKPFAQMTGKDALVLVNTLNKIPGLKTGALSIGEAGLLTAGGALHGGKLDLDTFLRNLTYVLLGKAVVVAPLLVLDRPQGDAATIKEPEFTTPASQPAPAGVAATTGAPIDVPQPLTPWTGKGARDAAIKLAGADGSGWVETKAENNLGAYGKAKWGGSLRLDWAYVGRPLLELYNRFHSGKPIDAALLYRVKSALSVVLHEHTHMLTGNGGTYAQGEAWYVAEAGRVLEEGVTEAFTQDNIDAFIKELGFGPVLKDLLASDYERTYANEVGAVRVLTQMLQSLTGIDGRSMIRRLAGLNAEQKWFQLTKQILKGSGLWDRMDATQRLDAQNKLRADINTGLKTAAKDGYKSGVNAANAIKQTVKDLNSGLSKRTSGAAGGSVIVTKRPPKGVIGQPRLLHPAQRARLAELEQQRDGFAKDVKAVQADMAAGKGDAAQNARILKYAQQRQAEVQKTIDQLTGTAPADAGMATDPASGPTPSASADDLWIYDSETGEWTHWGNVLVPGAPAPSQPQESKEEKVNRLQDGVGWLRQTIADEKAEIAALQQDGQQPGIAERLTNLQGLLDKHEKALANDQAELQRLQTETAAEPAAPATPGSAAIGLVDRVTAGLGTSLGAAAILGMAGLGAAGGAAAGQVQWQAPTVISLHALPAPAVAQAPSANASGPLTVGPITATLDPAQSATTFRVNITGAGLGTITVWVMQPPPGQPDCNHMTYGGTGIATWHHGTQDGCLAGQGLQEGFVTFKAIGNGLQCSATYTGPASGTGPPATCTTAPATPGSSATVPGSSLPGTTVPGSTIPGSTTTNPTGPTSTLPGSTSTLPGSTTTVPGSSTSPTGSSRIETVMSHGAAVASSSIPGGLVGGALGAAAGLAAVALAGVVAPAAPADPIPVPTPTPEPKPKPRARRKKSCRNEQLAMQHAEARLEQARAATRAALAAFGDAQAAQRDALSARNAAIDNVQSLEHGEPVVVDEGGGYNTREIFRGKLSTGELTDPTSDYVLDVHRTFQHLMTPSEAQSNLDQANANLDQANADLAQAQAALNRAEDAEAAAVKAFQDAREAYAKCMASQ